MNRRPAYQPLCAVPTGIVQSSIVRSRMLDGCGARGGGGSESDPT